MLQRHFGACWWLAARFGVAFGRFGGPGASLGVAFGRLGGCLARLGGSFGRDGRSRVRPNGAFRGLGGARGGSSGTFERTGGAKQAPKPFRSTVLCFICIYIYIHMQGIILVYPVIVKLIGIMLFVETQKKIMQCAWLK